MINSIRCIRGLETDMPILRIGEVYFCEDTHNTYVGTIDGNVNIIKKIPWYRKFIDWLKSIGTIIINKVKGESV